MRAAWSGLGRLVAPPRLPGPWRPAQPAPDPAMLRRVLEGLRRPQDPGRRGAHPAPTSDGRRFTGSMTTDQELAVPCDAWPASPETDVRP
jgi:hypothetical protein